MNESLPSRLREMSPEELIAKLKKVAMCVYLAADEDPARDISETCLAAAFALEALRVEKDKK